MEQTGLIIKKVIMKICYLLLGILFVTGMSCSSDTKPIESFSYAELMGLLFAGDEGTRIEWHDEPENLLTGDDLVLRESKEACGEDDCGTVRYITNTNPEKAIKAVIKFNYSVEGFPGYAPREYKIPAGGTMKVACTHFCYSGKSYTLTMDVVDSVYMDEESGD